MNCKAYTQNRNHYWYCRVLYVKQLKIVCIQKKGEIVIAPIKIFSIWLTSSNVPPKFHSDMYTMDIAILCTLFQKISTFYVCHLKLISAQCIEHYIQHNLGNKSYENVQQKNEEWKIMKNEFQNSCIFFIASYHVYCRFHNVYCTCSFISFFSVFARYYNGGIAVMLKRLL